MVSGKPYRAVYGWTGQGEWHVLEMRAKCDHCGTGLRADKPESWICSYECTYCADCARALDLICPNCNGEMVERPVREARLMA